MTGRVQPRCVRPNRFSLCRRCLETSQCLAKEAIVALVRAAGSGDSDDSYDAVGQPARVVAPQEAQRMTHSLRDFVFAKDPLLSYVLDALEKGGHQLCGKQSKLTDDGFFSAIK